jgi:hypothetical protein
MDPELKAAANVRRVEWGTKRRDEDPEFRKSQARRSTAWKRRKMQEDPGYFTSTRRAERKARKAARTVVIPNTAPRLPAGPFRIWLEAYQRAWALPDAAAVARKLEICERRASGVLSGGQDSVTIDVVDRALINARLPVCVDGRTVLTIDDLYPQD